MPDMSLKHVEGTLEYVQRKFWDQKNREAREEAEGEARLTEAKQAAFSAKQADWFHSAVGNGSFRFPTGNVHTFSLKPDASGHYLEDAQGRDFHVVLEQEAALYSATHPGTPPEIARLVMLAQTPGAAAMNLVCIMARGLAANPFGGPADPVQFAAKQVGAERGQRAQADAMEDLAIAVNRHGSQRS